MSKIFEQSSSYNTFNSRILKLYNNEIDVLDVGSGTGALAREIKKINPGLNLYGIDLLPLSENNKEFFDNFYVADLENGLPEIDKKFDLIILGDVLEHLKRPDIIIGSLKNILKKDGKMIVSVPNIAYFRIRLGLLFGNFNYKDSGVLDKTHLRFFTQKSIKDFIKKSGFEIEKEEFNFYYKFNFLKKILNKHLLNIFYRLFSVQFIFKLKIKDQ